MQHDDTTKTAPEDQFLDQLKLRELRAANIARQKEWDPKNLVTLAYRGNELGGECGEAQNVIKKLERERLGIRGSTSTRVHLGEELADVVICADLCAMDAGLDLAAFVRQKFNATSDANGFATRLPVTADWSTASNRRPGNVLVVSPIEERIEKAIARITTGGAPMRIPAEELDADLVLNDALEVIRALKVGRDAQEEEIRSLKMLVELHRKSAADTAAQVATLKAQYDAAVSVNVRDTREYAKLKGELAAAQAGRDVAAAELEELTEDHNLELERLRAETAEQIGKLKSAVDAHENALSKFVGEVDDAVNGRALTSENVYVRKVAKLFERCAQLERNEPTDADVVIADLKAQRAAELNDLARTAMNGILSAGAAPPPISVARNAYEVADAMQAERDRRSRLG